MPASTERTVTEPRTPRTIQFRQPQPSAVHQLRSARAVSHPRAEQGRATHRSHQGRPQHP
ncbi:hypothetical protein [Kitasatospora albolonga]|uniref:hypothetical protein n=1 Tax=Kitasatospora albolonga TaxID=68173 RepID=UPI0031EFDAAA